MKEIGGVSTESKAHYLKNIVFVYSHITGRWKLKLYRGHLLATRDVSVCFEIWIFCNACVNIERNYVGSCKWPMERDLSTDMHAVHDCIPQKIAIEISWDTSGPEWNPSFAYIVVTGASPNYRHILIWCRFYTNFDGSNEPHWLPENLVYDVTLNLFFMSTLF